MLPRGILTFSGGKLLSPPVIVHAVTWLLAAATAWIGYFSAIHDKAAIHNDHEVYAMFYAGLATACPVAAVLYAMFLDPLLDSRYMRTFVDAVVFGVVFATLVFAAQALNVAPIGNGTPVMLLSIIFSCLGAGMVVTFHIEANVAPADAYPSTKVAPESVGAALLTKAVP